MPKIRDMAPTLIVIIVALAIVAVGVRVADTVLGGLPGGAELVAWAFGISAVVASLVVAAWLTRARGDGTLAGAVVLGLAPFAVTGLLTVVAWYVLFYGSGHYDKGGYERLASAFVLLVAAVNLSVVVSARLVARATLRDSVRVARVLAITMFAFVATVALPPLL